MRNKSLMRCNSIKCHQDDQIKDDETGLACGPYVGEDKMLAEF